MIDLVRGCYLFLKTLEKTVGIKRNLLQFFESLENVWDCYKYIVIKSDRCKFDEMMLYNESNPRKLTFYVVMMLISINFIWFLREFSSKIDIYKVLRLFTDSTVICITHWRFFLFKKLSAFFTHHFHSIFSCIGGLLIYSTWRFTNKRKEEKMEAGRITLFY